MSDMLVKLYELPNSKEVYESCREFGVEIRRAMSPDKKRIIDWIREYSGEYAAGECETCFGSHPISCFIATRGAEILGYACYDATALGFFGPTRVVDKEQGKGIGKALLLRSLEAMREKGYGYAIIGSIGPQRFYEKTCGAILIENSTPGIYKDFLRRMEKESGV